MNFLEELVAEYGQFTGGLTSKNIRVNKLKSGGYEGELDVLVYLPHHPAIIHYETSTDAYSWDKRIEIFKKKFDWHSQVYFDAMNLMDGCKIYKWAVIGCGKPREYNRKKFENETKAKLLTMPELMRWIEDAFDSDIYGKRTVPESFPLLRAIQNSFTYCKMRK